MGAGPVDVNTTDCKTAKEADDCLNFQLQYCMFQGDLLEHMNDIKDVDTCQLACSFYNECKYYIWNKKNEECTFLTSGLRECDTLRGLPTPDYKESCNITPPNNNQGSNNDNQGSNNNNQGSKNN